MYAVGRDRAVEPGRTRRRGRAHSYLEGGRSVRRAEAGRAVVARARGAEVRSTRVLPAGRAATVAAARDVIQCGRARVGVRPLRRVVVGGLRAAGRVDAADERR